MRGAARPRRALLFCPGTDARKIEKAAASAADSVILDLEDAAALDRKQEARETVRDALARLDFGPRERVVRINPVGSGLEDADLDVLAGGSALPDALMLPKVEDGEHVRRVARRLDECERSQGLAPGAVRILALIETARGVVFLREIAFSDPRLDALVFGAEDLCGDIGATRTATGHEVRFARSSVVLHAAAARLQAIDTPFVDLADEAALIADTRAGLELGYTGRLAIHPRQLAPILAVFTPSAAELATAERLLAEHERHQKEGKGVFALDGRMVDMPMVRAAERVVARARQAGPRT